MVVVIGGEAQLKPGGGYLSPDTVGTWAQTVLCAGLPCVLQDVNSIPGLYPLDAGSVPPCIMTTKMSPDISKCPLGAKSSLVESAAFKIVKQEVNTRLKFLKIKC